MIIVEANRRIKVRSKCPRTVCGRGGIKGYHFLKNLCLYLLERERENQEDGFDRYEGNDIGYGVRGVRNLSKGLVS